MGKQSIGGIVTFKEGDRVIVHAYRTHPTGIKYEATIIKFDGRWDGHDLFTVMPTKSIIGEALLGEKLSCVSEDLFELIGDDMQEFTKGQRVTVHYEATVSGYATDNDLIWVRDETSDHGSILAPVNALTLIDDPEQDAPATVRKSDDGSVFVKVGNNRTWPWMRVPLSGEETDWRANAEVVGWAIIGSVPGVEA